MSKLKICGLRRMADIEAVNRWRPDYVGFVFAPGRREVSCAQAQTLIAALAPGIRTVGVFVNAPRERIIKICRTAPLNVVQLHGDETAEDIRALRAETGCEIWKAVRVRDKASLATMHALPADRFLLDAYHPAQYGGIGNAFDWELLDGVQLSSIILAGGIDADNIGDALSRRPYMLDISSGVETDGVKDEQKIRRIIELVRHGSIESGNAIEKKEF